jgi:hypothetical protein
VEFTITNEELYERLDVAAPDFERYVSPILNLANQYAQATRPRVVGQMTDLIRAFPGETLDEWKEWYAKERPTGIDCATDKLMLMVHRLHEAIEKIDAATARRWIEDLVFVKTFIGLRIQQAILERVAKHVGQECRVATVDEEARGIDGFVGPVPVSVKPATYEQQPGLTRAGRRDYHLIQEDQDGVEGHVRPTALGCQWPVIRMSFPRAADHQAGPSDLAGVSQARGFLMSQWTARDLRRTHSRRNGP